MACGGHACRPLFARDARGCHATHPHPPITWTACFGPHISRRPARWRDGDLPDGELRAIEDACIVELVARQQSIGVGRSPTASSAVTGGISTS
jgi:hypothetical protein